VTSSGLPWALVALLALGCLLLALAWWRAAGRVGRENRRRATVARAGESGAEALLARRGYRVTGRQETRRFALSVDGEEVEATCRADLLVAADDGSNWVAEVKTGGAARATRPQTRRQLLEYALVFDVDGVLLVDMEAEEVHEITFPFLD
jgi:hypothetical protein